MHRLCIVLDAREKVIIKKITFCDNTFCAVDGET